MGTTYSFTVTSVEAGHRLDVAITAHVPELSRSRAQALLDLGMVTLIAPAGSKTIKDASLRVKPGQMFTINVPDAAPSHIEAQAIALDIVYEDAHLLVLNKAPGMTVHPAPGSPDSTLVNALLAHCGDTLSGIGGVARPGIVHRLDKDTSGLMVVAKHDAAHHALSDQLAKRTLKRVYLAVAWGVPMPAKGAITGNIGRHPKHRQKMAVVERGKEATTHYKVLEIFNGTTASLLECRLETGRTHQIRVHMKHVKHPLIGDPVYGKKGAKDFGLARQALHAYQLSFIHPNTGKTMHFEARLPHDMEKLLIRLRQSAL